MLCCEAGCYFMQREEEPADCGVCKKLKGEMEVDAEHHEASLAAGRQRSTSMDANSLIPINYRVRRSVKY